MYEKTITRFNLLGSLSENGCSQYQFAQLKTIFRIKPILYICIYYKK